MIQKNWETAIERRGAFLFKSIISIASLVVIGVGIWSLSGNSKVWGEESGVTPLKIPEPWVMPFFPPPDDILREYMQTPVATLLKDKAVSVNDTNFEKEVYTADRPVLVIFYGDSQRSEGLGALVTVLYDEFPQIKLCAYDCKYIGKMEAKDYKKLKALYPVINVPALLFYDMTDGRVEFVGREGEKAGLHIDDGPKSLAILKQWIDDYSEKIKKYLVDKKLLNPTLEKSLSP